MIGTVTQAFVEALRASEFLENGNVSVVIANDNGEGTVNTALPAVGVSVKGVDREIGEYIGGMIEQQYIVQLIVMTLLDNPSASEDEGYQYEQMDLHYKVMLYVNQVRHAEFFRTLMQNHDFNINFRGVETEQTRGMGRDFETKVNVHRLVYVCEFLSKESNLDTMIDLEHVEMNCQCGEVSATEIKQTTPNIARSNGSQTNTIQRNT